MGVPAVPPRQGVDCSIPFRAGEAAGAWGPERVDENPRGAVVVLEASKRRLGGLASSYGRLHRFDLADRAYAQAIRVIGSTTEILNDQGGDYGRARRTLLAAQGQ